MDIALHCIAFVQEHSIDISGAAAAILCGVWPPDVERGIVSCGSHIELTCFHLLILALVAAWEHGSCRAVNIIDSTS